MKITKGQLKRIIAEEHAVVYGTKRKTRRPVGRRKTAKKRFVNEAKRELILEIQSRAVANELLEEGFFDAIKAGFGALKDLGGKAAGAAAEKAGAAVKSVSDTASNLKKAAGDQIKALKDAGKEGLAAVQTEFMKKYTEQIRKKIEEYTKELVTQMKKEDPEADDEAIKALASPIVTGALTSALQESIKGDKRMRLIEAKKRQARRRR